MAGLPLAVTLAHQAVSMVGGSPATSLGQANQWLRQVFHVFPQLLIKSDDVRRCLLAVDVTSGLTSCPCTRAERQRSPMFYEHMVAGAWYGKLNISDTPEADHVAGKAARAVGACPADHCVRVACAPGSTTVYFSFHFSFTKFQFHKASRYRRLDRSRSSCLS